MLTSLEDSGFAVEKVGEKCRLGSCSHWTLELTAVQPVRVYPGMKIGQVSFWLTDDNSPHRYCGRYHRDSRPAGNRDRPITRMTP